MKDKPISKILYLILVVINLVSIWFLNITPILVSATGITNNEIEIDAESCILIDSKTGLVLYDKDAGKSGVYPASTTKILTAIVALENASLNQVMIASQEAVNDIGDGGMNIGIMAGEEVCLCDLLNAMLVCSANETANIIAENVAPSREKFINMMNNRAKELGAVSTNFVNTCGIHNINHSTSAKDMALIARHAMTIPTFREIVKKEYYDMPITNKHKQWNTLYTTNKLIRQPSETNGEYDIIGIKTGFTTPAGHNLISAAINDQGMELISVVLGVRNENAPENVYSYTLKLFEYGFENCSIHTLINSGDPVYSINIEHAKDNIPLDVVTEKSIECVLPLDKEDMGIQKKIHLYPEIKAPLYKGDVVGYVEFLKDELILGKTNIIAAFSIEEDSKSLPMHKLQILWSKVSASLKKIEWKEKLLVFGRALIKLFLIFMALLVFLKILRFVLRRISRRLRMKKLNKNP